MKNDQWHAGRLLAVSGSYWQTCVLHAGVKLGLFTHLDDTPLTAPVLAEKIGGDVDGTTRLLDALTAMALLSKQNDRYENTPAARIYLSRDSDQYVGHMILHHHHLMESWCRLDEAVISGEPISEHTPIDENTRREHFLMGMFNNASLLAPDLVQAFDLSRRRHLLDLGGGPGTYAIHFCRQNPTLKATVFDLATTRPFAEKTIARYHLSHRIEFMAGNYIEADICGHYDVVWMSQIVHSEEPAAVQSLIKKVAAILEPGGMIMIHDFILEDTRDGPLFPALFALNMLVRTPSGRSYSQKQLTEMISRAGFKHIKRHAYRGPTDSGVITAIK